MVESGRPFDIGAILMAMSTFSVFLSGFLRGLFCSHPSFSEPWVSSIA